MAGAKNKASLRPKIICKLKEREWVPAVELSKWLDPQSLTVLQNGWPLAIDEHLGGNRWPLREVFGQITVRLGSEGRWTLLGCAGYLLFRLHGDAERGHRVVYPSHGWYIAMVPDTWERDEALADRAPLAPEPTSVLGYRAHFFMLEKTGEEKIAFRTPAGGSLVLEPKRQSVQPVEPVECSSSRKIWWAMGEENEEPTEWTDKPLVINDNDLAATSNKALWLRLTGCCWAKKIFVGFKQKKARPYIIRPTKDTVAVPLREFCDSEERDQPQKHLFQVWATASDMYAPVVVAAAVLS